MSYPIKMEEGLLCIGFHDITSENLQKMYELSYNPSGSDIRVKVHLGCPLAFTRRET